MKQMQVRDGERLAKHLEQVLKLYHYSFKEIKYNGAADCFNISIKEVKSK